jgi:hypothetical protein
MSYRKLIRSSTCTCITFESGWELSQLGFSGWNSVFSNCSSLAFICIPSSFQLNSVTFFNCIPRCAETLARGCFANWPELPRGWFESGSQLSSIEGSKNRSTKCEVMSGQFDSRNRSRKPCLHPWNFAGCQELDLCERLTIQPATPKFSEFQ